MHSRYSEGRQLFGDVPEQVGEKSAAQQAQDWFPEQVRFSGRVQAHVSYGCSRVQPEYHEVPEDAGRFLQASADLFY